MSEAQSDRSAVPGVRTGGPGSELFRRATDPHNASADQVPALVACPTTIDQIAAVVSYARGHELTVVPQATGHGAAGRLDDQVLMIDTSELTEVVIDRSRQRAIVGAGATWRAVNGDAERLGLLGRAGSAPSVGVSGYTFGGGAGWLTRPHGLAASALLAVDYVDGTGQIRRASDAAADPLDRDAMWAFRGGGGLGVASRLEFELVPMRDLWAGYLLWPIGELDAVVSVWASSVADFGPTLNTSIAILQAPPTPAIPKPLREQPVVHLALASSSGPGAAVGLLRALSRVAAPAINTWGSADVTRLGGIHLDPTEKVPAIGLARWLDDSAPVVALQTLKAALDGPIAMIELRNVAHAAPARIGAMAAPLGNFMLHAVAGPAEAAAREQAFERIRAAAASAGTGYSIGSWVDGQPAVPDALPSAVQSRLHAIRRQLDPDDVIAPTRFLRDP